LVGSVGATLLTAALVVPGRFVVWNCNRPSGYYNNVLNREHIDWGVIAPGTIVSDITFLWLSGNDSCYDPNYYPYGEPNNPNCTGMFLTLYSEESGFNDPTSVPLATYAMTLGSGPWQFAIHLSPGEWVTIPTEQFGYGFLAVTSGDGDSAGPWITRPGPEPIGAPGAVDWIDRFSPPGKWAGGLYQSTFQFGGFDPNKDPNMDGNLFAQLSLALLSPSPAGSPCQGDPDCFGDQNGDCRIDNSELQMLLDSWNAPDDPPFDTGYVPSLDFDGSHRIDNGDLQVILDKWGNDCN
jgi:hypothetical protein